MSAPQQTIEPRLRPRWRRSAWRPLGLTALLRSRIRASELWLVGVAIFIGAAAGLLTVVVSVSAHAVQAALFGLRAEQRLSASVGLYRALGGGWTQQASDAAYTYQLDWWPL